MKKEKLIYLDSLRAFAAICVAILHSSLFFNTFFNKNIFIQNSYLMVEFFFVLSGFVIAFNYQDKITNSSNLFNFQLKRFLRLYPLHLLTLLLFLGFDSLEFFKEILLNDIGLSKSFQGRTLDSFIHNLFLTHNFFLDYNSWNGPSWSISAEFYTYLFFAILLLIAKKMNFSIILFSILIIILSFLYLINHNFLPKYGVIRCFYGFFLGVLIYNIYNFNNIKIHKYFSYFLFIFSLTCLCVSNPETTIGLNIFIPIIFSILILSLVLSTKNNFLIKVLSYKFLVYLGSISYGIYMIHYFFWKIYSILINTILNFQFSFIEYSREFFINFFIFLGLLIILYLAHLSYKYFEKPISNAF